MKLSQFVKEADDKEEDKEHDAVDETKGNPAFDKESVEELADAEEGEQEVKEDIESEEAGDGAAKQYKPRKLHPHHELINPYVEKFLQLLNRGDSLMQEWSTIEDDLSSMNDLLQRNDAFSHPAIKKNKKAKEWLLAHGRKKRVKKDPQKSAEVIEGLVKVANSLDALGDGESLNMVEAVLQVFAKKDNYVPPKYDVKNERNVEATERKYPEAPLSQFSAPSLSTRYCPDHNGCMMKRIAEGSFQCELDGKVYNWNEGFKDYAGNTYPGGSIHSIDFPPSVDRVFETRELATRKNVK